MVLYHHRGHITSLAPYGARSVAGEKCNQSHIASDQTNCEKKFAEMSKEQGEQRGTLARTAAPIKVHAVVSIAAEDVTQNLDVSDDRYDLLLRSLGVLVSVHRGGIFA